MFTQFLHATNEAIRHLYPFFPIVLPVIKGFHWRSYGVYLRGICTAICSMFIRPDQGLQPSWRRFMSLFQIISAVVAALLLVYLVYALLKPEAF